MQTISFKRELQGELEDVVEKVTAVIKPAGFGVLTRIDFDQKIKEKLGETVPKTVVLGVCNPQLAYEAYKKTTDVTLFIPCNIVVREIAKNKIVVEAIRPSAMLQMLPQIGFTETIAQAEKNLANAIDSLVG